MNVAKVISRHLPRNVKERILYVQRKYLAIKGIKVNEKNRVCINHELIEEVDFFSVKGYHVYFGYYDLKQIDDSGNRILVILVPRKAKPGADAAQIGYFTLRDKEFHFLVNTKAWSWQQACRLRWHPTQKDCVIYNDLENEKTVTHIYDINTRKVLCTYEKALYDISNDFKYGVSLNFYRLQRLRPGYGYSGVEDNTANEYAPKQDGLFLVNLESGQYELILPLYEVARKVYNFEEYEHYFNHVSFSPDGSKFMVYHLYKHKINKERNIKIYIYDLIYKKYYELPIEYPSHYCWINDEQILFTHKCGDGKVGYARLRLNGEIEEISTDNLSGDGHPTILNERYFISDTYPNREQYETLFIYDRKKKAVSELLRLFHKPVFYNDMRCDLHPRVQRLSGGKLVICCDTTAYGKRRIVLITLKESVGAIEE